MAWQQLGPRRILGGTRHGHLTFVRKDFVVGSAHELMQEIPSRLVGSLERVPPAKI